MLRTCNVCTVKQIMVYCSISLKMQNANTAAYHTSSAPAANCSYAVDPQVARCLMPSPNLISYGKSRHIKLSKCNCVINVRSRNLQKNFFALFAQLTL